MVFRIILYKQFYDKKYVVENMRVRNNQPEQVWQVAYNENGFEYYCLVPQGGKAELRLPKFAGASSLTVNGNAVVKEDDGEVYVFDLECGEYSFIQR